MSEKYKIIKGKVHDTGLPIDGCVLYFSKWNNDKDYYLYTWDKSLDDVVMQTMYKTEEEAGIGLYESMEEFEEAWKKDEWQSQGEFCLKPDAVDAIEVVKEM